MDQRRRREEHVFERELPGSDIRQHVDLLCKAGSKRLRLTGRNIGASAHGRTTGLNARIPRRAMRFRRVAKVSAHLHLEHGACQVPPVQSRRDLYGNVAAGGTGSIVATLEGRGVELEVTTAGAGGGNHGGETDSGYPDPPTARRFGAKRSKRTKRNRQATWPISVARGPRALSGM